MRHRRGVTRDANARMRRQLEPADAELPIDDQDIALERRNMPE